MGVKQPLSRNRGGKWVSTWPGLNFGSGCVKDPQTLLSHHDSLRPIRTQTEPEPRPVPLDIPTKAEPLGSYKHQEVGPSKTILLEVLVPSELKGGPVSSRGAEPSPISWFWKLPMNVSLEGDTRTEPELLAWNPVGGRFWGRLGSQLDLIYQSRSSLSFQNLSVS